MTATAFVPAFRHPPVNSPWFDFPEQAPWEPGVYAVLTDSGESRFSYWRGDCWRCTATTIERAFAGNDHPTFSLIVRWHGIVPPSRLPRFVSETWPEAVARVPALRGLSSSARAVRVFDAVDSMPGYDLMCAVPLNGSAEHLLFIFRRRDPA